MLVKSGELGNTVAGFDGVIELEGVMELLIDVDPSTTTITAGGIVVISGVDTGVVVEFVVAVTLMMVADTPSGMLMVETAHSARTGSPSSAQAFEHWVKSIKLSDSVCSRSQNCVHSSLSDGSGHAVGAIVSVTVTGMNVSPELSSLVVTDVGVVTVAFNDTIDETFGVRDGSVTLPVAVSQMVAGRLIVRVTVVCER